MKLKILTKMAGRIRFAVLMALVLYIAVGCTERIDITTDEAFQKLAVEGYITPGKQVIRLTETSGYFSQLPPAPVSDAVVTVSDGSDTYQFAESPEEPGNYYPPEELEVIPESTYTLTISLSEEIGGESYFESSAVTPRYAVAIDSTRAVWRDDFEVWVIELYALEPSGPDYYMFNAFINGTPVTDSLSRIGITDDRLVDGNYLYGVFVLFLFEDEVSPGDTLVVSTSAISQDYFRYLVEAQTELRPNNPLFSGPPANVKSNISNGALGYFAVYSSDFSESIVKEIQ